MNLRGRLAAEDGFTLSEMLVVCAILGIVVAALVQLFVSASHAEINMNNRFQAQQQARVALDSLRREIHCANKVTSDGTNPATFPATTIVINLSSFCPTTAASGSVDGSGNGIWCTVATGGHYALYRKAGTTCASLTGAVKKADFLTTGQVFTGYSAAASCLRAKLSVDLPVSVTGNGGTAGSYELRDDIVLRNTPRGSGC